MLERLERAKAIPENQDQVQQFAIEGAKYLLSAAKVVDPSDDTPISASETKQKSEFIFDHRLFTYFPERGGIIIMKDGRIARLNYGENSILQRMARNRDKVTTLEEFAQIPGLSDDLLKKNIQRLRYKLGDQRVGDQFRLIKSVPGIGYILSTLVDEQQENQFLSEQPVYIHSSGLKYCRERFSVIVDGKEIFLYNRQKRMLDLFVENENQVLSTQKIWEETLAEGHETTTEPSSIENLVNRAVGHLRKKIKDKKVEGENNFTMIQTIHDRGYMWFEPGHLQFPQVA